VDEEDTSEALKNIALLLESQQTRNDLTTEILSNLISELKLMNKRVKAADERIEGLEAKLHATATKKQGRVGLPESF